MGASSEDSARVLIESKLNAKDKEDGDQEFSWNPTKETQRFHEKVGLGRGG